MRGASAGPASGPAGHQCSRPPPHRAARPGRRQWLADPAGSRASNPLRGGSVPQRPAAARSRIARISRPALQKKDCSARRSPAQRGRPLCAALPGNPSAAGPGGVSGGMGRPIQRPGAAALHHQPARDGSLPCNRPAGRSSYAGRSDRRARAGCRKSWACSANQTVSGPRVRSTEAQTRPVCRRRSSKRTRYLLHIGTAAPQPHRAGIAGGGRHVRSTIGAGEQQRVTVEPARSHPWLHPQLETTDSTKPRVAEVEFAQDRGIAATT